MSKNLIEVKNVTAHAIVLGVTMMTIPPLSIAHVDGNDGGVKDMLAQGKLVAVNKPEPSGELKDPDDMTVNEIIAELKQYQAPARASEGKDVLAQRLREYRSGDFAA